MIALSAITSLVGTWRGENQLWLAPGEPVRKSETTAEIEIVAHAQFTEMRYQWADEGHPQEGRIILGQSGDDVKAVWFDTWHMANQFMLCDGRVDGGAASVRGAYAAPPGPDWGWRVAFEPRGADAFRFTMYNITPDGQEFLAVEVLYSRTG
ncbi:MAG: DUF1579 family protein [Chloroflexi bacterium]|nr:DUF1579 family protein [Chloroflexota bacterium]